MTVQRNCIIVTEISLVVLLNVLLRLFTSVHEVSIWLLISIVH